MFPGIDDGSTWLALLSLCAMEIVLGIDNVVFISILTSRLPKAEGARIARIGIGLAMLLRIGLLFALSFVLGLKETLFSVLDHPVTGRDLVLLAGGLFLLGKATNEIYLKVERDHEEEGSARGGASAGSILAQLLVLDLVFSLDSVITAVGMVPPEQQWVMVTAVIVSVVVMLIFAAPISGFVMRHPSVKILALSFLLLIGVMLVADGAGQKIPKGYIYAAMLFSLTVELLNLRYRKKRATRVPPTAESGHV